MRGFVLFVVLRSPWPQILAPEPHLIYCQHEEDYKNNPPKQKENQRWTVKRFTCWQKLLFYPNSWMT
jgi:hypothetical protein